MFLLTQRFGELLRKLWNPRNFKAHVSPHEMLQSVVLCSKKRFQITQQGKFCLTVFRKGSSVPFSISPTWRTYNIQSVLQIRNCWTGFFTVQFQIEWNLNPMSKWLFFTHRFKVSLLKFPIVYTECMHPLQTGCLCLSYLPALQPWSVIKVCQLLFGGTFVFGYIDIALIYQVNYCIPYRSE